MWLLLKPILLEDKNISYVLLLTLFFECTILKSKYDKNISKMFQIIPGFFFKYILRYHLTSLTVVISSTKTWK